MKAIIRVSGNWCNGYWWEIARSDTGCIIKECGPYHEFHNVDAKRIAHEDAVDYADRNDIEIIR